MVGDTYQGYGLDDPMVVTDAGAWPFAGTGVTDGTQLKGVEAGDYDAYDTTSPARLTSKCCPTRPCTPASATSCTPI